MPGQRESQKHFWFDRAKKTAGQVPVREISMRYEPIHEQNSSQVSQGQGQ